MAYIGKQPGTGVRNRFLYTATAGQTTFTTSDSNLALSYSDALYMDVYLNGVLLDPANDYTATSGTSVVLGSGATAGDILEIVVYDVFSIFNNTIDGNFEVGGNLTVDTDTLHVDSTNNRVGVGTDSPDTIAEIRGANPIVTIRDTETGSASAEATLRLAETGASDSLGSYWDIKSSGGKLEFIDNWDEGGGTGTRVTINDSGNVGIGTSSPAQLLSVEQSSTGTVDTLVKNTGTGASANARVMSFVSGASGGDPSIGVGITGVQDYFWRIDNSDSDKLKLDSNGTTRMTIDSSGRLLVNATSPLYAGSRAEIHTDGSSWTTIRNTDATTAQQFSMVFARSSSTVGSINTTNTSTVYVTSSDYRLKENVTGITDGIQRVKQLNPSRFNFIADADTTVDGFLAHEAQTVVPEAVTGTHNGTEAIGDITDADNNTVETGVVEPDTLQDGYTWTETGTQPVYQGIDQAKLVPVLTAALQEAIAKIEALETQNADFKTRLTALEAG